MRNWRSEEAQNSNRFVKLSGKSVKRGQRGLISNDNLRQSNPNIVVA